MIPALNFFRRHGTECPGSHPALSLTSQSDERKKGWKRCDCPIVASGTLDRISKRVATRQTDWDAAAQAMALCVAANSWDRPRPEPPTPTPAGPAPKKKSLMSDAAKAFLEAHEKAKSSQNTIDGHHTRMALALNFAKRKGIVRVDQWTTELVKEFLDETPVAISTGRTYQAAIKAFFGWCIAEEWMTIKNPAKYKPSIRNLATTKATGSRQKFPFSDAELDRMFAACAEYDSVAVSRKDGKIVPCRRNMPRKFQGRDLAEFIAVSAWTGMRISNVAKFNISQLKDNDEVHIRTVKGDVPVYTAVPDWLGEIIRARAAQFGPCIFGGHSSTRIKTITGEWRERLRVLWRLCGPWEVKPTPHRFRHTFARILLQKGESPADVAQLLGNTEAVVIEHYAAWVRERQERLSALLKKAFADVRNPIIPRKIEKVRPIRSKVG